MGFIHISHIEHQMIDASRRNRLLHHRTPPL
jgi:hypothetical protein